MKKVALKILLLFAIVFTINSILSSFLVDYDWGDDVLQTKNEYYKKHYNEFNSVMIGGSLFYRHLDGHQFDSLNALQGIDTRSFNFGADGNNHIKQMILLNRLLDSEAENLDYIFFALSSNSYFEDRNMHTKKFVTWMNWKSLRYVTKIAMNEDASLFQRLRMVYRYTLTWIENKVKAGLGMHLIKYKLQEEKRYVKPAVQKRLMGENLDGFNPYRITLEDDSASLNFGDRIFYWSHSHFHKNYDAVDTIIDGYYKDIAAYDSETAHYNKALLKEYESLIKKAEKKGIQLIALIPPRSRLPYSVLLPIYDRLPAKNKMYLGDPNVYPEYYEYDNTFNFYHLNPKGARIYTEDVSTEFLKIVSLAD